MALVCGVWEGGGEYRLEGLRKLKAHIPPETAYALGNNAGKKGNKQHGIDMPNAKPPQMLPNVTIFNWLVLGLAFGWLGFMLGLRDFSDTNIWVLVTQNACIGGLDQRIGGLDQCEAPSLMGSCSCGIEAKGYQKAEW